MAMYQAADTFNATLKDGSSLTVTKGSPFHESHELVKLELDSAAAAAKAGASRSPLLVPMDSGETAKAAKAPGKAKDGG